MTLRSKLAVTLKPYLPRSEANAELAADAVLALLSDPANISDEMVGTFYWSQDRAIPPPSNSHEQTRRAIAAAFTAAKESETK